MEIDPNQIGEVLEVAGQGTKTLGGALDLLKQAKSIFSGGPQGGSDEELKALVGELAQQLTEARMTNLELVTMLQALQKSAESQARFDVKLSSYKSYELPDGGRVLRTRKADVESDDWDIVCPVCAHRDQLIVPLQGSWQHYKLKCPTCGSEFPNQASFTNPTPWHV